MSTLSLATINRVLELLFDRRDGWWDMQELARAAGLDARGLEKALAELSQRGHQLDFSPALGMRLHRPGVLDAHLIERDLGTRRIGRHVICFPILDSTNDTAAASAAQVGSDGLVVLAEAQRKGRGRHGRRWLSPPGANILMSVLLKLSPDKLPLEAVTIAAGLAVAEGIEHATRPAIACTLKWPNDVLVDGRKVAGILVEQRTQEGRACTIIGLGVNVNAHPPAGEVDRPPTSLSEHAGEPLERIDLVRGICRRLDEWVERLTHERVVAVEQLRQNWSQRCAMLNERVTVLSAGRRYSGRVVDIDPLAGLALLTDGGTRLDIPAERATIV